MADCNHDCGSCGKDCGDRTAPGIQKAPMNKYSNVKKVIGVISGKGGVGKSSITSMLAVAEARRGKKVAIMDADITGPSIPKAFGVHEKAQGNDEALLPVLTDDGIKIMSINLLLEDETDIFADICPELSELKGMITVREPRNLHFWLDSVKNWALCGVSNS